MPPGGPLFSRNDDKERVRDATDIVRIIGERVALKPKGREFAGLCPFHDDHNPSMMVVPAKQIFHCFVCGAGGDAFSFVQRYYKLDFVEAMKYLAERAGVVLTPRNAAPASDSASTGPSRAALREANAFAQEHFMRVLADQERGQIGRDIIIKRGISPEMQSLFAMGLSTPGWDGLTNQVMKRKLDPRVFVAAGLLKSRENGDGFYDSFRNRLMFPIHDKMGNIIAFGARKIDEEDEPKYLNSSDTPVFHKSTTLYGLYQASRSIQQKGFALVTEGYTDTIACHQGGMTNAVAALGTAFTRDHAEEIRRLCDRVVLLFDGDDAGQRAADRAIDRLTEVFFFAQMDVSMASLSKYTTAKDPDELLKQEGGRAILEKAIDNATGLIDYRIARLAGKTSGSGFAGIQRALKEELEALAALGLNEIAPPTRTMIIKRIAELLRVQWQDVQAMVPAGRPGRRESTTPPPDPSLQEQPPILVPGTTHTPLLGRPLTTPEVLLGCVLCDGSLWLTLSEEQRDFLAPGTFASRWLDVIVHTVEEISHDGGTPGLRSVLDRLESESARQEATQLEARVDRELESTPERLRKHFTACLATAANDAAKRAARDREPGQVNIADQLIALRERHAAVGGNQRSLPKPP